MTDCLTCEEIELKMCALADEIAAAEGCSGLKISEGGTQFDYSAQVKAKSEALKVYREMFELKCKGANELYEFVHVPCVQPVNCVGSSCSRTSQRTRRRYSR